MIESAPLCMFCKHYHRNDDAEGFRCDAFPEGIPSKFIDGDQEHRSPEEGDHGIQFEIKHGVEDLV